MFRTLNYIWKLFWKRPSRRVFFIFFRMLKTEIKCLMLTGYSTDELLNQSGGGMERRSPIRGRGERNSYRFESCPDYTVLATSTEQGSTLK